MGTETADRNHSRYLCQSPDGRCFRTRPVRLLSKSARLSFVAARYIGKSVDSVVLTAYLHLFSVIVSLPFLFASYPKPVNTRHAWRELMCYAATILAGVFGQLAQSRALQIGPPTKTTTLLMTNMLLAGTIGVVALSESMTWLSFVGAGIIIISVMVVTMQDSTKQPRCDGYQQFLPESDEGTP